jgi:hypothetical protein
MFGSQWLANAGGASYEIDQSIRFNDNDSAYLTRTPGSAGNQRTFTFSTWVKFCTIKADNTLFSSWIASGASAYALIYIDGTFNLRFEDQNNTKIITDQVFRDTSAWYHVVVRVDTTDSTSGDRYQMYINGSRVTSFKTETQPAVNYQTNVNKAQPHYLGRNGYSLAMLYSDLYQAETHFIDGTALAASSFGETNDDGVWIPKAYSGSYGTNGFYLTGATASDLGEDFSGNNNDFTSSGLTTADQRLDTPTLNKATFNPLQSGVGQTLSDGNLVDSMSGTSGFWNRTMATQSLTYKTYWEINIDTFYSLIVGVSRMDNSVTGQNAPAGLFGAGLINNEAFVSGSYVNESGGGRTFPVANGTYVMLAYDPARNALWMGTEGTWRDGTGSSASSSTILSEIVGTGTSYAIFTGIGTEPVPFVGGYATNKCTARFSSEDWEGTVPTGYEELSTAFIATPSITDGSKYFQPVLYTGTTSAFDVTFSGNSDLAPDWLWFKTRATQSDHFLFDKLRGVNQTISSNDTTAEVTSTGSMTAFGTDGFSLGDGGSDNDINGVSGTTYVAWGWAANGAGSANTDGSINTNKTSANATAGFSIIEWSGTAANGTIGHGLGIQPSLYIVKNTATTNSWMVGSTLYANTKFLNLNATAALDTAAAVWNSTYPTSSVINLGSNVGSNGSGTNNMICYAFAEIPGYSSIGSYTGNGSTDGPFVYTGFTPRYVLFKRTNAAESWPILDTARGSSFGADAGTGGDNPTAANDLNNVLVASTIAAEEDNSSGSRKASFNSNGFKVRTTNTAMNGSGSTYIYMAFAEHPFGGDGVAPATAR